MNSSSSLRLHNLLPPIFTPHGTSPASAHLSQVRQSTVKMRAAPRTSVKCGEAAIAFPSGGRSSALAESEIDRAFALLDRWGTVSEVFIAPPPAPKLCLMPVALSGSPSREVLLQCG